MSDELENCKPESLWKLRFAVGGGAFGKEERPAPYCGHETSREELEARLWEYAEADMPAAAAEAFWRRTRDCAYCLQKLLAIQEALKQAEAEEAYPLARARKLIKRKKTSRALRIALNWVKDSLALIDTGGLLLPPGPEPVLRGKACHSAAVIRVLKEFPRCAVEVSAEKTGPRLCGLELKVSPAAVSQLPPDLRVALKKEQRLVASNSLKENSVSFEGLLPGSYEISLAAGDDIWAGVLIEIREG